MIPIIATHASASSHPCILLHAAQHRLRLARPATDDARPAPLTLTTTVMAPYFETAKVRRTPLNRRIPPKTYCSESSTPASVACVALERATPVPCAHAPFQSFADVPITDDGVDTATFLLASTDFVNMFGERDSEPRARPAPTPRTLGPHPLTRSLTLTSFRTDLLGGGVFAFVQNDLRSNIGVCSPPCELWRPTLPFL